MTALKVDHDIEIHKIVIPTAARLQDMSLEEYDRHKNLYRWLAVEPRKSGVYIHVDSIIDALKHINEGLVTSPPPRTLHARMTYRITRPAMSTLLRRLGEYFAGFKYTKVGS